MNNDDRRIVIDTIRRLSDDYHRINREYSSNMMDYNRNFRQLLNMVSSQNHLYNNTNTSTRRNQTRYRDQLETELLGAYLTQINQQIMRENGPLNGLSEQQMNVATELVTYDASLNEQRCPITHEDFEEGEEVCRIRHCGHYFKTDAIRRWFQRNTVCPVCRHNLIQPSTQNSQFISNILSNVFPADSSLNTVTYTFDIPFNTQT